MNPSEKEKDEGEMDSITESKPKSAPTDQETETPPTQSGEDSSSQPPTQSGQATSSRPFSQIPSLSTAQRISAMIGEGPVPEFFMMQVQNLPKSPRRKSNLGMNPSGKEKDEMETDSIAESDSESTPTDQEIEKPPTQSGVATPSQPSSQTQSGVATSSRPNQILLTTVQRIAATLRECKVPAFIGTQHPNLPKSLKRKSNSGLPLLAPKKPKLTYSDSDPDSDADYDADLETDYDPTLYLDPDPDLDPVPDDFFDVIVSNSDCLPIPRHHVENFFPYYNCNAPFTIHLTDPCCRLWPNIICVAFCEEEAFILSCNWAQYAEAFNLRVMDAVRFRPKSLNGFLVRHHFVMQHFPRPETEPVQLTLPEFLPPYFLFQVELGRSDVGFGRLVIHVEQMRIAWPGSGLVKRPQMLKLTDCRDKNWYVRIAYSAFVDRYVVMDGWPGFVREHDLVAGDWVRFYKQGPTTFYRKHFLIQFVRRWPMRAQNSTIQHPLDPWPTRTQKPTIQHPLDPWPTRAQN